jgi:hypothetical protein
MGGGEAERARPAVRVEGDGLAGAGVIEGVGVSVWPGFPPRLFSPGRIGRKGASTPAAK